MTSITVCGTARVAVAPDRASVELGLTHVARTSALAMDVVAGRSQQLADLLDELGFSRPDWTTQGVSVEEEWEWKRDTNTKVGYRATTGTILRLFDLGLIETLLSRAIDDVGVGVRGLRWFVSEHNPARRSLLAAAAIDAIRRADAYADALGLQRGEVEEVSELPISSGQEALPSSVTAMMHSKTAEVPITMNVNPGEIELHASVYVRFSTVPYTDLRDPAR